VGQSERRRAQFLPRRLRRRAVVRSRSKKKKSPPRSRRSPSSADDGAGGLSRPNALAAISPLCMLSLSPPPPSFPRILGSREPGAFAGLARSIMTRVAIPAGHRERERYAGPSVLSSTSDNLADGPRMRKRRRRGGSKIGRMSPTACLYGKLRWGLVRTAMFQKSPPEGELGVAMFFQR